MPAITEWYPLIDRPGWFLTADGYEVYSPVPIAPPPDPDLLRRRLLADLAAGLPECVALAVPVLSVAIDGRRPAPAKVAAVHAALERLPKPIRRELSARCCRYEVIGSADVADDSRGKGLGKIAGLALLDDHLAIVAAECREPGITTLHEAAHLLDGKFRGLWCYSRDPVWKAIWQEDLAAGNVSAFSRQRTDPAEYFAESFAKFYWSPATRNELTQRVQDYIARLPDAG